MASPDNFAILGITFASLIAAVYATRKTLEALTRNAEASRWWALLVIFMAYFHYLLDFGHPCCIPFQLPYDLPSMMFFAVGLFIIVKRQTALLYLLLFIAMLNRESAVFLVGVYFLYETGLRRSEDQRISGAFLNACCMFVMCVLVLIGLHHLYTHASPGLADMGPFEDHIVTNVGALLRPYYWTSYLSMFGFSWIYLYSHWKSVPHIGIRYALAIGPIMLVAMYVVAVLSEIRIFGDLISLFVVALSLLLQKQFGSHSRVSPATLQT